MEEKIINKIKCLFGFHEYHYDIYKFNCFCTIGKCKHCGYEDWSLE